MIKNIVAKKDNKGIPEVLVYGYIDADMAASFAKEMKALEKTSTVINVRINSGGGSVYDGIAMFNIVRQMKCAVDMYVDGIAASMASAIAVAGRKLYMSRFARLMTHRPSGGAFGHSEELRAVADEIDQLEPTLNAMYCEKTGLTPEEVTAQFLNSKNNFFSAADAKAAKLADDIYDGEPMDMPAGADIKAVYEAFQVKLTASMQNDDITNTNNNMKQISLTAWAQICATMGITDSVEDSAIVAAIKKLKADADKLPGIEDALAEAEDALEAQKTATTEKEVSGLLEGAFTGKKITAAQKTLFARQYKDKPEELKAVLDTMGFTSVVGQLNTTQTNRDGNGEPTAEVKVLVAKGWDKLDREGGLSVLKEKDPLAYEALYEGKFGYKPNEKPKPRGL